MIKRERLIGLLQKNIFNINFIFSLFLLYLTPIVLLLWLILFVPLFLKYLGKLNLNSFLKSSIPILLAWYLILIVSLSTYVPVIVGPGYTGELILTILIDKIFFARICLCTIVPLHYVSEAIGTPIILPVFNIF